MERKYLKGKIGFRYKKEKLGFTGLVGKCGCLLSSCPYCILDSLKGGFEAYDDEHRILK